MCKISKIIPGDLYQKAFARYCDKAFCVVYENGLRSRGSIQEDHR